MCHGWEIFKLKSSINYSFRSFLLSFWSKVLLACIFVSSFLLCFVLCIRTSQLFIFVYMYTYSYIHTYTHTHTHTHTRTRARARLVITSFTRKTKFPEVIVADSSGRAVCGRLTDEIAGSNHADGIGVRLLCILCYVGSGLCDEFITHSEESYLVCVCVCVCLIVFGQGTSTIRRPRYGLRCCVTEIKESNKERTYLNNSSLCRTTSLVNVQFFFLRSSMYKIR
jgi:hypothetical protein